VAEFRRLDYVAQGDGFAMDVGNFDAYRGFAGDAFDQDGFGLERQAEIVAQVGDAAVFDAGFGLEFESGDDRAGIDLGDVAADVEFHALGFDGAGAFFQFALVHFFAALGIGEQRGRGQLVGGLARRDFWFRGFLFRWRRSCGFVFVEFDDCGGAAGVTARFFGFAVFFFLVFYCEFFGGNALARDGRASGDFDFFDALAQAIGFAGFAPVLDAGPELA